VTPVQVAGLASGVRTTVYRAVVQVSPAKLGRAKTTFLRLLALAGR
jgi:hypothetical protein